MINGLYIVRVWLPLKCGYVYGSAPAETGGHYTRRKDEHNTPREQSSRFRVSTDTTKTTTCNELAGSGAHYAARQSREHLPGPISGDLWLRQ